MLRIKDAIGSLQLNRKKDHPVTPLCSPWSEGVTDGPDAVPLPEYPRPQLIRGNWQCLNGWWDYCILAPGRDSDTAVIRKPDGKILVPFSPETDRSGVRRTLQPGETLWYARKIAPVSLQEGYRLILHFGAVDERCTVYWNGQKVGSHRNGYLPFSFDVTDYLSQGENELKLSVRDDTDQGTACRGKQTLSPAGMFYHAQSGIWQTVWMEKVPPICLDNLKITPLTDEQKVRLQLKIKGLPEPSSSGRIPASGEAPSSDSHASAGAPSSSGEGPSAPKVRITLEGRTYTFRAKKSLCIRLPVKELRLWSPENPFLYPLEIHVGEDKVSSYFAMRSFGTGVTPSGHPCLTLNGSPYFFNGVLDQGYWPESLMTAPADEAMIFDITEMKRLSFNTIRKHIKIEPARWYYHCDRLGMIVWQDMVNGGGPLNKLLVTYMPTVLPGVGSHMKDDHYRMLSRSSEKSRKQFEKDTLRMIRLLYNTPSIGLWTLFNEGWGQFDALRITERIKAEDPTRPVDHASGWFDQKGGDILSIHNYYSALTVRSDRQGRPFVLTEYGGYDCRIPDHAMSENTYGYRHYEPEEFSEACLLLMEECRNLQDQGMAGAVYTQLSDIEEETNGLLTYDRKVCKL